MAISSEALGHGGNGHALERVIGRILHRERSPQTPTVLFSERARREAYEREGSTYVGNVYLGSDGPGPGQQVWRFRETNPEPGVDGDRALRNGDYLTIYAPPDPENPEAIKRVCWEGTVSLRDKMIRNPQGELWNFPYPEGGVEGYWVDLFGKHCEAELRTPVVKPSVATAGETAMSDNTVFGGARVREPVFRT